MSYKDRDWLEDKYVTRELCCRQIALLCGCAERTIHQRLVMFGIPRRKGGSFGKWSEERRERERAHPKINGMLGKKHTPLTKLRMSIARTGPMHPNWRGGITASQGYVFIWLPGHPKADRHGYVKRSRLVLEQKLGRYLLKGCIPHHKNHIKDDDIPENLEEKTESEHRRLHALITNGGRIYKRGYTRPFGGNQYVTSEGIKKNQC